MTTIERIISELKGLRKTTGHFDMSILIMKAGKEAGLTFAEMHQIEDGVYAN